MNRIDDVENLGREGKKLPGVQNMEKDEWNLLFFVFQLRVEV